MVLASSLTGWLRLIRYLLWGDRDEEQARASLRQALAELRRSFGDPSWDHTARLDWADEAWSESYISRYGSPAITINATAGVTLVLSEASLYDANAAGLTLERAVAVFLGRYGPKQCSHIIDLSKPIPGLTVKLLIQREKPLPDASSDTRQGVKDALENADVPDQTARHRQKRYDSETVFEVTSEGTIVTFDYMPEKKMQCISPSAPEERESLYGTI